MSYYHHGRTKDDAIIYLTDCTLATVSHMAMLKTKTKSEYERQINIAQHGVNFIKIHRIMPLGTRADKILKEFNGSVREWVKQYEVN